MDNVHRLYRRLLPAALGLLAALPAGAFVNDIEIVVARGRLGQCGTGWDPQHTGRWSGGTGSIVVQGRKLHEFNLSDPAECDRVLKTRVDAPANQRIEVVVINQGGSNRMAAPLTTVAADRVWRVEYFADQAWGNVVSTNWPKDPPAASAGGFANDIRIRVAPGRLSQCGAGWDPQRTGHWSGNIGSIFVDGRKVHDFNLALQDECDLVTRTRIVAAANQRIEVLVVNQGGSNRMAAPLTTVAADRVWQVEYFADQASGSVVSTDWPGATSGPSHPDRPVGPAPVKPPHPAPAQRGYQLYFDGKLVSGPDAEFYTRQQALDNCAWNRRTKPHIRIDCVHNGQPLNP